MPGFAAARMTVAAVAQVVKAEQTERVTGILPEPGEVRRVEFEAGVRAAIPGFFALAVATHGGGAADAELFAGDQAILGDLAGEEAAQEDIVLQAVRAGGGEAGEGVMDFGFVSPLIVVGLPGQSDPGEVTDDAGGGVEGEPLIAAGDAPGKTQGEGGVVGFIRRGAQPDIVLVTAVVDAADKLLRPEAELREVFRVAEAED